MSVAAEDPKPGWWATQRLKRLESRAARLQMGLVPKTAPDPTADSGNDEGKRSWRTGRIVSAVVGGMLAVTGLALLTLSGRVEFLQRCQTTATATSTSAGPVVESSATDEGSAITGRSRKTTFSTEKHVNSTVRKCDPHAVTDAPGILVVAGAVLLLPTVIAVMPDNSTAQFKGWGVDVLVTKGREKEDWDRSGS